MDLHAGVATQSPHDLQRGTNRPGSAEQHGHMRCWTLRFPNRTLESRFCCFLSQRLAQAIDRRVVAAQTLSALVFDIGLLLTGTQVSWALLGGIQLICLLHGLVVLQPWYPAHRSFVVLCFRAVYTIMAIHGLPQWSLNRTSSLMEHLVFAAGNTVLLHLATVQPVLLRLHLLVQPMAFLLNAWAMNQQVCTAVLADPGETAGLLQLHRRLTWVADHISIRLDSVLPAEQQAAVPPGAACHATVLFIQAAIGLILSTALVWWMEMKWRQYYLQQQPQQEQQRLQAWLPRKVPHSRAGLLASGCMLALQLAIGLSVVMHFATALAVRMGW